MNKTIQQTKTKIELRATCGKCGYVQILRGFEDIIKANKNEPMKILYNGFLLVNDKGCYNCGGI
jgi:ribosomal protein S27AE